MQKGTLVQCLIKNLNLAEQFRIIHVFINTKQINNTIIGAVGKSVETGCIVSYMFDESLIIAQTMQMYFKQRILNIVCYSVLVKFYFKYTINFLKAVKIVLVLKITSLPYKKQFVLVINRNFYAGFQHFCETNQKLGCENFTMSSKLQKLFRANHIKQVATS